MTVVLVAVYVPIGFQGGLTGALFTEFAFTLVGAVTVSAIVALTLSPMMCSRLLKTPDRRAPAAWRGQADAFHRPQFRRGCAAAMNDGCTAASTTLPVTLTFAAIVLGSIYFLYSRRAKTELAPQEDQGVIITQSIAAPNATLQQRQLYSRQVYKIFASHPETEHVFQLDVPGQSIAGMVFKPWDQRTKTTNELQPVAAAGAEQGRRRARRRLPAAAAARQLRPAGAVRHRDHRSVRAAQRCRRSNSCRRR